MSTNGSRGSLGLWVYADRTAVEAGALALEWPPDECSPDDDPVSEGEYLPVLEAARSILAENHPALAAWESDELPAGTPTELSLTANTPLTSVVCKSAYGPYASQRKVYVFETPAQVSTSDGRISASLPGFLDVTVDANGDVASCGYSYWQQFRAEELEATLGIHGVDLLGSGCGMFRFGDSVDLTIGESRGYLEIDTQRCEGDVYEPMQQADFLSWCSGPCEFVPMPHFERPRR